MTRLLYLRPKRAKSIFSPGMEKVFRARAQGLLLGEAYEEYCKTARRHRKAARSARWYREYINDLEVLSLAATLERGAGARGRWRLVKIGHAAVDVKRIMEKNLAIIEGSRVRTLTRLSPKIECGNEGAYLDSPATNRFGLAHGPVWTDEI